MTRENLAPPLSDNEAIRRVLALATARLWGMMPGEYPEAEAQGFCDAVAHVRKALLDHGDKLALDRKESR